ncbi:hypothetical protein LHL20_14860 [Alteromonas sp. McT4-15]|jgi:hypothetical protein|uniref:hypothetical protein n=1 Tax=unclassified Alteromonas TaxID=2614992 RepID=UPI0019239EED|nr:MULTISPECIES: hypothetical protein [unclassified Alteromonas]MEC8232945.1 hypothetical protein [Pseudomonadota bacterium]MCB4437512.1 hypothetical protein [Alteromonas sp. McT4-15]WDT86424.1 hypothetical protein OZ660_01345 [Alteromonas sp. 009811495]BCO17406.1 hypothetical protein KUC3_02630 [Alteromonas sp. KC3]BCO21396.1 hypothetical protein KUC14_02650 [Alteromonas sp. KC14]
MKQQTLIALSALVFSSSVLANGGFEPNKKACVNVGKEITRVSSEMDTAKSGIQKSWLKRQLNALETKRNSCSTKGYEANSQEIAKL